MNERVPNNLEPETIEQREERELKEFQEKFSVVVGKSIESFNIDSTLLTIKLEGGIKLCFDLFDSWGEDMDYDVIETEEKPK